MVNENTTREAEVSHGETKKYMSTPAYTERDGWGVRDLDEHSPYL